MSYDLLTGATGLLGTYLLRDLMLAGRQVAVVVRSGIGQTAGQRIENVLARWERQLAHALPRPPVLEGNLHEPDLGLDRAAVDWVAANCTSVLHNAASLSFQGDPRSGEPRRSNVDGTRHVLELCHQAGIRQFHHVSTAYVCGLRTGRILETELDVGQTFGNDYEQSKVEAEKLVRGAEFLDPPTIYRPSIIIGDSRTGYTTTFHGFYTPLKIIHALGSQIDVDQIDGRPMIAALGLTGQERKNFVPVDWVSQVVTYLFGCPKHHGQTYHVTPTRPASVAESCEVMEQALRQHGPGSTGTVGQIAELEELRTTFLEQMEVYRAYWRDDPQFDRHHTVSAAGHLPCPEVDFAMLLRTSEFAMRANFGWPRPVPLLPDFNVRHHLQQVVRGRPEKVFEGQETVPVGLQVNGPGGGQWTLAVANGSPVAAEEGLNEGSQMLLYLNSETFERCVKRKLSARQAIGLGHVAVEGSHSVREHAETILEAVTGCLSPPAPATPSTIHG